MISLSHICREIQYLCNVSWVKLRCLFISTRFFFFRLHRSLLLRTNSFLLQVLYFVALSALGFWVLRSLKPRTDNGYSFEPRSLDLFFTSISAATVSSMSTVEMEVFSNAQLVVLTVLMFVGGEVFTSMLGLHLRKRRLWMLLKTEDKVTSIESDLSIHSTTPVDVIDRIELGMTQKSHSFGPDDRDYLRYLSVKFLGSVVLVYLVSVQVLGIAMVSIYLKVVSSAREVLRNKGLKMINFSVFTTISTFASCGFVPTNENMAVFGKNSALLLILIPQVLLGNTLFPSCLRFCLWALDRFMNRAETSYLLRNAPEIGYLHLLPRLHSRLLVATVFGFIGLQFVMFCALQWSSSALSGLGPYEKIVAALFQCVNTRHTGETVVDLSKLAPGILVLFVVMMYLPPYTSFLPVKGDGDDGGRCSHDAERNKPRIRGKVIENLIFSQLSYLVIFVILTCITEREKMKEDPLNFNVFNIVVEVTSAYGNVGFTMGYSCGRQLKPEAGCTDRWVGFVGRWSDRGKVVLMVVMIFGRLKKFNMNGGRGWKLL